MNDHKQHNFYKNIYFWVITCEELCFHCLTSPTIFTYYIKKPAVSVVIHNSKIYPCPMQQPQLLLHIISNIFAQLLHTVIYLAFRWSYFAVASLKTESSHSDRCVWVYLTSAGRSATPPASLLWGSGRSCHGSWPAIRSCSPRCRRQTAAGQS